MDIVFVMGVILGFFLGMGFCIFFTDMLAHRILGVLGGKPKKKKHDDNADDEPANYWKPKGWRPDKP